MREYSQSIQGCSINLINGLITAGKHSAEIRSTTEEEGWCSRMLSHGRSITGALLYQNKTNQT